MSLLWEDMDKMCIDGSYMCFSSITFLQKQSYVEAFWLNKEGEWMLYLKMGLGQGTTDIFYLLYIHDDSRTLPSPSLRKWVVLCLSQFENSCFTYSTSKNAWLIEKSQKWQWFIHLMLFISLYNLTLYFWKNRCIKTKENNRESRCAPCTQLTLETHMPTYCSVMTYCVLLDHKHPWNVLSHMNTGHIAFFCSSLAQGDLLCAMVVGDSLF